MGEGERKSAEIAGAAAGECKEGGERQHNGITHTVRYAVKRSIRHDKEKECYRQGTSQAVSKKITGQVLSEHIKAADTYRKLEIEELFIIT